MISKSTWGGYNYFSIERQDMYLNSKYASMFLKDLNDKKNELSMRIVLTLLQNAVIQQWGRIRKSVIFLIDFGVPAGKIYPNFLFHWQGVTGSNNIETTTKTTLVISVGRVRTFTRILFFVPCPHDTLAGFTRAESKKIDTGSKQRWKKLLLKRLTWS